MLLPAVSQAAAADPLLGALKVFARFALICCEGLWYHLVFGVVLGMFFVFKLTRFYSFRILCWHGAGLGELPFLIAGGVYVFYTSTIDYSCSSRQWWYDAFI